MAILKLGIILFKQIKDDVQERRLWGWILHSRRLIMECWGPFGRLTRKGELFWFELFLWGRFGRFLLFWQRFETKQRIKVYTTRLDVFLSVLLLEGVVGMWGIKIIWLITDLLINWSFHPLIPLTLNGNSLRNILIISEGVEISPFQYLVLAQKYKSIIFIAFKNRKKNNLINSLEIQTID